MSQLIIRYYNETTAHSVKGMTVNKIRNADYWVINCNSDVKSFIAKCANCRHLRESICQMKMGNLPRERLSQKQLFTYYSIDMCGPILVKEGRKKKKKRNVFLLKSVNFWWDITDLM